VKWEPGKIGQASRNFKARQSLSYDGRGNIDLNAGTLSFFIKPNYEIREQAYSPMVSVATEIEGYWAGVLQFNLVRDTLHVQFYDMGRYTPTLSVGKIVGRWKPEEWVHLAVAWDRDQGVRV